MKKTMTRYITIPVEKLCDVTYCVWAEPYEDPHFRPEPAFVLDDKWFDTEEEAENYLTEWKKNHAFFGRMTIYEEITELE